MPTAYSHCHFCGSPYIDFTWPRRCNICHNVTYHNLVPSTACVVPIEGGRLLLVRRATEPLGLCCPGGFLEFGEEWSEGCVRELAEETGIIVPAQSMSLHTVITSAPPEQTIVIFGLTPELRETDLLDFMANSEVSELVIVDAAPAELAFSNHAQVVCTFFS